MSDSSTEPEPTRPASSPSGSSPADEQTIIGTPQPAQGGEGGLVRLNARPGLSVQDLADDPLLARAPKRRVEPLGVVAPALGGIPILARLGKGGMGAVYYGVHPRLDIEVAVKVLPTAPAQSNPDLVQRFLREAKVAAKVKSAHLVGVLDVNDEAGLYYIVMEYVRGESAGELLRRVKNSTGGGLSEFGALELLEAAAKGLAAAHRAGIIHRDIKPDNLMIPKREGGNELLYAEAKLADLGLARSELADVALTGNQAAMGTPGYMAPEQGKDARTAGKPADVFSMGAALFALLSGRAPFQGPTAIKILFATLAEPHPPIRTLRPDVSPATAALIDRCLQKDPAARYADAGELAAALAACKAGLSAAPRTPNAPSSAVATSVPGAAGPHTPPPLTPAPAHAPPGPPQVDRASNKAALIAGLLAGVLIFGGLGAWGLVVLGRDLNSTADPLPQPQPLPQPLEPVPSPPYVDPGPTPPPPPEPPPLKQDAHAVLRALRTPEQVQAYRAGLVDRVRVADLESGAGMIDLLMWDEIGELSPAELDVLQAWSRDKRKVGKKTARQILAVFIVNWVARQAAYSPEQVKTFLTGAREMLAEAPLEDPVLLMETAALYAYVEPVSAESRERCVNAALELMDARDVNALPPLLRACQMQQRGYANSPEYRAQGDWGRARGLFETAAGYFARAGDRAGQAQSLYQVGRSLQPDINLAGGDWTQAAACYAKGAGLLKDAGRPHAQAYFLRQQAYCLQPERNPIGNWDTAAKLYNESGALEALHAHVFEQADCLCMQGYCLSPVRNPAGNWETSARFYEQASKIYAASENKKRLQGVCLHEIAYQRIRADKRNLTPETRELFRRAGALRREAGDEQGAQISESWLR